MCDWLSAARQCGQTALPGGRHEDDAGAHDTGFPVVSSIVMLVLVMSCGALLQAVFKRRWVSIPLPTAVAALWLAGEAGLLHAAKPDSTVLATFIGFLPVILALYAGAATLGSAAASAIKARWCSSASEK